MNLRDVWREIKAYAGVKIHGLAYNIDIVNGGCPVSCPSCGVGSFGRRKGGRMSLELFQMILDKAQRETKVRNVQMYAHSDPTMHPDLHLFVEECTKRGIPSIVSTVLQRPQCDFEKVIESRPIEFRISFPGLQYMNYYQKGAKPEEFMKNFNKIRFLPRHKETTWTMAYHLYKDNGYPEMAWAERMAKENDIKFVMIRAIHMCNDRTVDKSYTPEDLELNKRLLETPEETMEKIRRSSWCVCQKQITIDAQGHVFLCQNVYDQRFRMVKFLDSTVKRIRQEQKEHPFCAKCKEVGGNTYQENYNYLFGKGDPTKKVLRERLK